MANGCGLEKSYNCQVSPGKLTRLFTMVTMARTKRQGSLAWNGWLTYCIGVKSPENWRAGWTQNTLCAKCCRAVCVLICADRNIKTFWDGAALSLWRPSSHIYGGVMWAEIPLKFSSMPSTLTIIRCHFPEIFNNRFSFVKWLSILGNFKKGHYRWH